MTWNVCVCVCVCAVGAVTVISPLELVRTKMQSRRQPYSELLVCIRSAVSQDGLLSLWRGWGPTVLRDVPFSGETPPKQKSGVLPHIISYQHPPKSNIGFPQKLHPQFY